MEHGGDENNDDDNNDEMIFDFEEYLDDIEIPVSDKRGRIMCRYWLEGRCARDDECSYLHEYDPDKFPMCQFGKLCNNPRKCKFLHVADELKQECTHYTSGFCWRGPACIYRHIKRNRGELSTKLLIDFSN